MITGLVLAAFTAIPALSYLSSLFSHKKETFEKGYKIYAYSLIVLIVLGVIAAEIIYLISEPQIVGMLSVIASGAFSIFLNTHFYKVVLTYSKEDHHDDHYTAKC